jgi:hypothetical protein
MFRPSWAAWMVLVLALTGFIGCGSSPQQADPSAARAALSRALDAWQKGEALDGFRGTSPALIVVEPQWRQGVRLLHYEVHEEPRPNGYDLEFSVKLSLQDRTGKKFQEKAVYTVSTAPALVVIRSEES